MIRSEMVQSRTEVVAERGVVSAGHLGAAEAGVRAFAEGGNAIDALVAAAFTAFVLEPASCGLGGYGHLALFLGESREFVSIDHYVRAPRAVRADMFEMDPTQPSTYYGWPRVVGRRNESGHLAPAVPGAVAGLCEAQQRFGRLSLAAVLEPAIEAAEAGIPVTWNLVLAISARMEAIVALPVAAAFLLPGGTPPRTAELSRAADRLDLSDLAATLRRIAREGAAGFYAGPVAEAIARECRANGGILTAEDLAAYRPKLLRETPASYGGHAYVTGNDPIGYEALNILDHLEVARHDPASVEFRHLMAEALGHAYADNMTHYGDPAAAPSPANALASRAFGAARAAAIDLGRAASRPIAPADPWPYETGAARPERLPAAAAGGGVRGTSQVTTADRNGNMASLITSLTGPFGSLVLVPETGIFLNNAMQNFDPRPGRPNSIAPGKMPIFAAPALVAATDGEASFASGGSGGYRITSGVLHTFVHAVDVGMGLQDALDAPRVHCQGEETFVDARVPVDVRARLAELGHVVVAQEEVPGTWSFGRVSAVRRDPRDGLLHAASGPAWQSGAAGI